MEWLIVIGIILWWACGMKGFQYWWSKQFGNINGREVKCFFMGLMGPLTWLMGWHIHGLDIKKGRVWRD